MTTPAQPDTGAGDAPDTGSAPQEDTTETRPAEETQSATDTPDSQAEIDKWKKLARKHEQQAKANKKALEEASKANAGEPTLEDLEARLSDADTAREEAEARIVELAYENAVNRIGSKHGLDVEAALDSSAFRDAVSDELDDEFDDADLAQAIEKAAKVFAKKPRFAASNGAPPRSGAPMPGAPAPTKSKRPTSLTEAFNRSLGGGRN